MNNREYGTDVPYKSMELAQESAATKAFMICRNFSANDGMYPGQRPGQTASNGMVQGLPVAIGCGRRGNRNSGSSVESQYSESTSSGGNSPRSYDGFEHQLPQVVVMALPRPQLTSRGHVTVYDCLCGRAPVRQYGRCVNCLVQAGWAQH